MQLHGLLPQLKTRALPIAATASACKSFQELMQTLKTEFGDDFLNSEQSLVSFFRHHTLLTCWNSVGSQIGSFRYLKSTLSPASTINAAAQDATSGVRWHSRGLPFRYCAGGAFCRDCLFVKKTSDRKRKSCSCFGCQVRPEAGRVVGGESEAQQKVGGELCRRCHVTLCIVQDQIFIIAGGVGDALKSVHSRVTRVLSFVATLLVQFLTQVIKEFEALTKAQ